MSVGKWNFETPRSKFELLLRHTSATMAYRSLQVRFMIRIVPALLVVAALCSCRESPTANSDHNSGNRREVSMTLKLLSTVFQDGGMIPSKYTCDGANISPPLQWSGLPPNTKSIALIVDDPDAPGKTWVHWVLYDLSPTRTELDEDIKPKTGVSGGGKQGSNDFRQSGYGGPCPPSGTHRYFFKIYALDVETSLRDGATKDELERAMQGHILSHGELLGRYQRQP